MNSGKQPDQFDDEGFLQRWSRRKYQQQSVAEVVSDKQDVVASWSETEKTDRPLCDDDMPPIDSLDENSDYSGFLSKTVSEKLRKQALRKLFSSQEFNIRDGLDDYDGDYTQFEKLGDIITADLKHRIEAEVNKNQNNEEQRQETAFEEELPERDVMQQAQRIESETELEELSEDRIEAGDDTEVRS